MGVVSPVLVLANFFEITLDVIMAQTVDSGIEKELTPVTGLNASVISWMSSPMLLSRNLWSATVVAGEAFKLFSLRRW